MNEIKKVETKYSVRDGGHYTPGMIYNGVLYISGQLSIDPETGKVPEGGIKQEARQALKNLDYVIQAAGASKDRAIHWGDLNEEYASYFGEHKPSRIVVPTNNLYNGCLCEIEAVVAMD